MCQLGKAAKIAHLIFTLEKYKFPSLLGIFQLFNLHLVTLIHDFTLLVLFSQQKQQELTIIIMCLISLHFIESMAETTGPDSLSPEPADYDYGLSIFSPYFKI